MNQDGIFTIKEDNIDFIKSCIKEHDDFSFKIKEIFNTKSSYIKNNDKRKSRFIY